MFSALRLSLFFSGLRVHYSSERSANGVTANAAGEGNPRSRTSVRPGQKHTWMKTVVIF
ncbi:MAG: hypothetical protein QOD75_2839 [Blastocatellia bacterium]|nr:hypothetical protein [Blastocatellia bacterium]